MSDDEGAAKMIIELKNSVITVKHGDTKSLLFKRKAKDGDWDMLWKSINKIGHNKKIKEVV